MRYILASASPRRRELMKLITEDFTVFTAGVDERTIEEEIERDHAGEDRITVADLMVRRLSFEKAKAAYEKMGSPDGVIVIGADTTVALSGEILGKPRDREDAVRMLRNQSLEPQSVITGVTVLTSGGADTFSETTLVYFKPLDAEQEKRIQDYCDTDDPYDKAGAYGIQGANCGLVDRYEGDFNNVVGFPVDTIRKRLERLENPGGEK